MSSQIYPFLKLNIMANKIGKDDYIITRKRRALLYAFRLIAEENGLRDCRITDVLYAGERDNPEIRKPFIIDIAQESDSNYDKVIEDN